jgi:hypothetical protein
LWRSAGTASIAHSQQRQVELEDAAVFLFGERLTAPISSIESWRKRHTHPQ